MSAQITCWGQEVSSTQAVTSGKSSALDSHSSPLMQSEETWQTFHAMILLGLPQHAFVMISNYSNPIWIKKPNNKSNLSEKNE